jgi:hypothetical protein
MDAVTPVERRETVIADLEENDEGLVLVFEGKQLRFPPHAAPELRACVASDRTAAECAAGWTRDVGPLLASDDDRKQASEYASYYVDFLRKGGGASPDCRAR